MKSSFPAPVGPVGLAMRQVADVLTPEKHYRVREAFMGYAHGADDVKAALELLTRSPAAPVVLAVHGNDKYPDPRLASVLRHPNVRTSGIRLVELIGAFDHPHESVDGLRATAAENLRLIIRHDLGHALRGSGHYDKAALLRRARNELLLSGTDDEVAAAVMAESALPPPAEHWDAEAAFTDWDGTLKRDGAVDLALLDKIRARAGSLPVAVWTGGDPDAVYRELRAAGVAGVHVASKQDARGMRVRMAVDDESPEDLAKAYGIAMNELIDVRSLLS